MAMIRNSPIGISLLVRQAKLGVRQQTFTKFKAMCEMIVQNTPVYSGELRHNYNIRYGMAPAPQQYAIGNPANPLPGAVFGLVFDNETSEPLVFGSSTPYVMPIEYGSWSNKAPNGMIRNAIAEVFGVL